MTGPLTRVWRSLADAKPPPAAYLGRALLADLPVTFAAGWLITRLSGIPAPDLSRESLPRALLALAVFAPLVETFGMAVIIRLARRFTDRPGCIAGATALVAAGLHSLARPLWGLEIFWAFVVFSTCYVAWERKSTLRAFWMTALLHSLHNLLATLLAAAR